MEEVSDAEVSQTLGMIEQLLQGHLEELRVIRENAGRPRAERGVGPDGGENRGGDGGGDEDDDSEAGEFFIPGGISGVDQLPSGPQTRERSPSPPQEHLHGMYS